MLISVIIPFHKEILNLCKTCISINEQVIPDDLNIEIVVGNDSKYSDKYIKEYLLKNIDKKLNILVNKNNKQNSPGNARNAAIEISNGEYIAFLDADDLWSPIKLLMQSEFIYKKYDFITCGYTFDKENIIVLPPKKVLNKNQLFFDFNPIGTSTVIVSKRIIQENKFSNIFFCQDILFWATLFANNEIKYASVNLPLVNYSTSGRTSNAKIIRLLNYYYIAARKSGLSKFSAILSVIFYVCRGIFSKIIKKNIYRIATKISKEKNKLSLFKILRFLILLKIYITQSIFFDIRFGVRTFLRKRFNQKDYISKIPGSIHYVASSTDLIIKSLSITTKILSLLKLPEKEVQFVDLGSGRGKTILIIAIYFKKLYKYNRLLGIELSKELVNIANLNLAKYISKNNFHIEINDALSSIKKFKEKIYIFYLYNSFRGEYFQKVCSHISNFQRVIIIYLEPVEHEILLENGFKLIYSFKSKLSFRNREFNIYQLCEEGKNKR